MAGARRPARRRWSAIERDLRLGGGPLIAGVDEVGRGPLAGPVVACAVIMPPDARAIAGVDDSKRLDAAERVRLARRIRERALSLGVGAASVREIERLNIFHATVLAMRRALARLSLVPDHVLVDGVRLRTLGVPHQAVVGGDDRCFSIACASIVAKVTRDELMTRLSRRHPGYRWERNAGYGTPDHLAGLDAQGLTAHHRRNFGRVGQLTLDLDSSACEHPVYADRLAEGSDFATAGDVAFDVARDAASRELPPDASPEPPTPEDR
jgi:ribonuclease HII